MKTSNRFRIHVAKSRGFENYERGNVAFITNGFYNNGVQGYVAPLAGDKVFRFQGINISAFCEATVQKPPFMGRGNGGSGMIVLEPLRDTNENELFAYAAYFNQYLKWRFSYGRMVTKDRIANLVIPEPRDLNYIGKIPKLENFVPAKRSNNSQDLDIRWGAVPITSLFELHSGDYHNASDLSKGNIPLISCGETNNGVMGFVNVPQGHIYSNTLTIAYNGKPLTTHYHPYRFAAKDDVAICIPRLKFARTTYLFIQYVLNTERWRFSYGRKCFHEKLCELELNMPIMSNGALDELNIQKLVTNTSYWHFIEPLLTKGIELRKDIIN